MTINEIDPNVTIEEEYRVKTTKYNGKYSKSTLFLLPMIDLSTRSRLLTKYLKNTFVDDAGIEHDFSNCLFLLFKVKNLREKDWLELTKALTTKDPIKEHYIMDYYIGLDNGTHLVMYVFKVPEQYVRDYKLFLEGKYSKISNEYKAKFPQKLSTTSGEEVESIVYGAMYKTDYLKNIITKEFNINKKEQSQFRTFVDTFEEIWDSPKQDEEIYRYECIKQCDTATSRSDSTT